MISIIFMCLTQCWPPMPMPEVDYVFEGRKFGGNAQAITSQRWCHHTSFLWDYHPDMMQLLTNPAKQPAYRQVSWVSVGAASPPHTRLLVFPQKMTTV